jgi:hypothetical protein
MVVEECLAALHGLPVTDEEGHDGPSLRQLKRALANLSGS